VEKVYEWQGRAHAALVNMARDVRGQGTVEYVGLILLVAVILAAVIAASSKVGDDGIAKVILRKLTDAIKGITTSRGG